VVDLALCDEISSGTSCSAQYVRDTLAANPTATLIRVRFNTVGGDVIEGLDIYRALVDHPARVEGYITGLAASIGSVILCACDYVRMAKGAQVMIHNPYGGVMGDAQAHRSIADSLDNATKDLVGIYQARTGKSPEELLALLANETYFDCDAAVAAGFADEIVPAKVANRELGTLQIESLKSPPVALTKMVARARSKALDPQICQVLGVPEDASLVDIVAAISALVEAAKPKAGDEPKPPAPKPEAAADEPDGDEMAKAVATLDPKIQAKILGLHTKATAVLSTRLDKIEKDAEARELNGLLDSVPANLKVWAKKQKASVVREYVESLGPLGPQGVKEPIQASGKPADGEYTDAERSVAKATGQTMAQVRKDAETVKGSK
jgi:ATP-dependent protease ClpP protease subunit